MSREVELVKKSMKLGLPLPRLQLVWTAEPSEDGRYDHACYYSLVLPVDPFDIRNRGGKSTPFAVVSMGKTLAGGGKPEPLEVPFRDGIHIHLDAAALNLPAFVVAEGDFKELT